ncbi:MAG: hypothetical protein ABI680_18695 [Chthoniobacteraceae bacterium]
MAIKAIYYDDDAPWELSIEPLPARAIAPFPVVPTVLRAPPHTFPPRSPPQPKTSPPDFEFHAINNPALIRFVRIIRFVGADE